MAAPIIPVVLAGGQGTRLWPLSRSARPKQFLPLTGQLSLFQETLKRVSDPQRYGKPVIITNAEYRFLVAEQAQESASISPVCCSSRWRATPRRRSRRARCLPKGRRAPMR